MIAASALPWDPATGGHASLHLARKAFFPAPPPFPFLHIATGWDFRALIEHRDRMAREYDLDLLVHGNDEATRAGVKRRRSRRSSG
jgi:3'-phosphoadenosine 5'-phosphosulfate sulfotransferase (PAPS reductase)/FAD synthetase